MSSAGLKMFALGMNNEIASLGRLALGTDFSSPTMGTPMGPEPQAPQAPQAPTGFPSPPAVEPLGSARGTSMWPSVQQRIFDTESGGDYNALLGYQNRPGGKFSGVNLTDMTVDEAIKFSQAGGDYANYSEGAVGRMATPMGAYQIVGKTLRGLKDELGLKGDEKMTPELQDRLGKHLWETGGEGQWEGLKKGGGGNSSVSTRNYGADGLPVDVSAMEDVTKLDPEKEKAYNRSLLLMGFGRSIGQLGRGETIDMSDVISAISERQSEARERLMEIAKEKRRQEEVNWNRGNEVTDRERNIEANRDAMLEAEGYRVAGDAREEAAAERAEGRAEGRADRKAEELSSSLDVLYPDSPWLDAAKRVTKINPEVGLAFVDQQRQEEQKAADEAKAQKVNDGIASVYAQEGYDDLAALASKGDLVAAREGYKQRTGKSTHEIDVEMLINGTQAEKDQLTRILWAESPTGDPREKGLLENELKVLGAYDQKALDNRSAMGQMQLALDMATNPKFESGKLDEFLRPAKQYLESIGLADTQDVTQDTLFTAISNGIIADYQALVNKGVATEADTKRYTSAMASLEKTPEANAAILYARLELMKRDEAYGNYRRQYFSEGGSPGNPTKMNEYINDKMKAAGLSGDVFSAVPSAENYSGLRSAVSDGKLDVGDLIKSSDGSLHILTQEAIDALLSED